MDILREPRITLIARPQFLEPAHLPVQWKGEASDGERIAEFAGRLCYMSQHNPAGRTTAGRPSLGQRTSITILAAGSLGFGVLGLARPQRLAESRSSTPEELRRLMGFGGMAAA